MERLKISIPIDQWGIEDLYDPSTNTYCIIGHIGKAIGVKDSDMENRAYPTFEDSTKLLLTHPVTGKLFLKEDDVINEIPDPVVDLIEINDSDDGNTDETQEKLIKFLKPYGIDVEFIK